MPIPSLFKTVKISAPTLPGLDSVTCEAKWPTSSSPEMPQTDHEPAITSTSTTAHATIDQARLSSIQIEPPETRSSIRESIKSFSIVRKKREIGEVDKIAHLLSEDGLL